MKRKNLEGPKEEAKVEYKKEKLLLNIAPHVKNLEELITLGERFKYYSNINIFLLRNILPALRQLNALIGMASIKSSIFSQVLYYLQGFHYGFNGKNEDFLHTVIYGPPGCGKTTVAKIIGEIYKGLYILSDESEFKTATRNDFVGQYLGHTAKKTQKFLKSCKGHCLLIDEVYSLAPRNSDRDSFSKEAVDTINQFLSENKEDFCCIIAGYEEDVKACFFNMNRGLERRFPWCHRIEEYSSQDLAKIFIKMLYDQGWFFADDNKTIENLIKENKEFFKFGGGSIETFINKCKIVHSNRVFSLENDYKYVITKEDLENTMNSLKSTIKREKVLDMYL